VPEAKRPKSLFEQEIKSRLSGLSSTNKRLEIMLEYAPVSRNAAIQLDPELINHPMIRTLLAAQELARRALDEDMAPLDALSRIQQMVTALIPTADSACLSRAAKKAAAAQLDRFT